MTDSTNNNTSNIDEIPAGYGPTKGPGYPVRLDERLYSVHEKIGGWSYRKAIEEWTKWIYDTNASENAATDYVGDNTEIGQPTDAPVFFLAGTFGGSVSRRCKVPKGRNLFFPVIADMYTTAELPARVTEKSDLLAIAQSEVNSVKGMSMTLDGTVFYEYDLAPYRCQSSFQLQFHESVIPTLTTEEDCLSVADGYWIGVKASALKEKGNHVIHFFATAEDGYTQDVTYFLEMVDA